MKRKIVKTKSEYVSFVKAQNNRTNVYTTVYDFALFSEQSKIDSSVILDRIFLDFDAHDDSLENAFEDLKMVMQYVEEEDIEYTCFFSGRGFHLFLYGEVTENIRDIQAYFRLIKKYLKARTNYDITLDDRVGQSTRLRRVPNTVNMSSRNDEGNPYYCIPINGDDIKLGLDHILILADSPRLLVNKTRGTKKIEWPESKPLEMVGGEISAKVFEGRLPILPCLYNAIMVENPSHMARAYLVSWYRDLLSGCQKNLSAVKKQEILDKIVDEIKWIAETHEEVWLDWCEAETRKHARFTVFREYTAPHCKTKLIPEGYCIGKCWRYPEEVKS
tara:strand:+ start:145 stop:1137 length:993 start_codon:yes stop_codon:yes gene_type:complete